MIMTVEEKILSHIEQNCKHPDGSPMMDEQTFYEGAKWGYNEAMRWRSVNEEMPNRVKHNRCSERVLVKIKDWDKIELMWLVYVDKDDDDASYWTNDDDYWVGADIEVEFWRPIE